MMDNNNQKKQPIKELFELWTEQPKINKAARIITGRLIKKYSYEKIFEAFLEAEKRGVCKLVYVEGILKKQAEKIALENSKAESLKIKLEEKHFLKTESTALDVIKKLNESLSYKDLNEKRSDESYKNTAEYKLKKQQFYDSLRSAGLGETKKIDVEGKTKMNNTSFRKQRRNE